MDINKLTNIISIIPQKENVINEDKAKESAILIPIVDIDNKLYILFEKRSEFVSQPGEICFPGGRIDKLDKSSEATAIRETMEELGVDKKDITVLGKLGLLLSHHRNVLHCHIGFINWREIYYKRYNQQEVAEIILVDIDSLMLVKPEVYTIRVKGITTEIDEFGNEIVSLPAKELGLPKIYHGEWDMGKRKIVSYDLGNIKIWGITGYILRYFIELIQGV